jgi:hypothetical protein
MMQTLIIKILQNLLPTFSPPFREFFISLADLFPALRKFYFGRKSILNGKIRQEKTEKNANLRSLTTS